MYAEEVFDKRCIMTFAIFAKIDCKRALSAMDFRENWLWYIKEVTALHTLFCW